MFSWLIMFIVLAIIAAALGFTGVAGAAAGVAQILFWIFLALIIVAGLSRAVRGRNP